MSGTCLCCVKSEILKRLKASETCRQFDSVVLDLRSGFCISYFVGREGGEGGERGEEEEGGTGPARCRK